VKYCYPGTKMHVDCKKTGLGKRCPHVLTVTNYGREFQCANAFEMGTRGENVAGVEGIGIGLYNAKRIADAHGASLECICGHPVSLFNVPLIEPYIDRQFNRKDAVLAGVLKAELERLKGIEVYEKIVARSAKGLRFMPGTYELVDLINKPTWEVTFQVTLPTKGS
jgi:hypothetical protein